MHTPSALARPARSHVASKAGAPLALVARPGERHPHTAGDAPAPTVIRCAGTADFLAALPFVTGFSSRNSLFMVFFRGKRGGDALRVELPGEHDVAEIDALLSTLVELLRDSGAGAEGPAVVITTARSFAECDGSPHRTLTRRLLRRFRREGWAPRELAVVAADGWTSLLGADPGARRPLDEITGSPVLAQTGELPQQHRDLDRLGAVPDAEPARERSIARHLDELAGRRRKRDPSAAGHESRARNALLMHGTARVAGACFEACAARDEVEWKPEARLVARLIEAAQQTEQWLAIALTALTRAEFVVSLAEQPGGDRFGKISPGVDFASVDGAKWSVGRLLFSLSHEIPEPQKLRLAIGVLTDAAAHAPVGLRPGLLSLLAWAWWMLGMQNVSQRLVEQSLAIDERHELTLMVAQLNRAQPASRLRALREQYLS